ncbi:hypothetical protein BDR26DRAFT_873097 [Obelidium mucronatum]|nr:hypothetical protein BDR26DRAFT_873097 [Obelidium mucronatum]
MTAFILLPTETIQEVFLWIQSTNVLKYRRLCKKVNDCLLDPHFARHSMIRYLAIPSSSTTIRNVFSDQDKQWFQFPDLYQSVYASLMLQHLTELSWVVSSWKSNPAPIPKAIRLLKHLAVLELSECGIVGYIPSDIWSLTSLKVLILSNCKLSGSLSTDIQNLSQIITWKSRIHCLKYLNLSRNRFADAIPMELGLLPKLKYLALNNNKLDGCIPSSLKNLSKTLSRLYLQHNKLTGSIPIELSEISSLQFLSLARNKLEGLIPGELGHLVRLQSLNLSFNALTGGIPSELGALRNLSFLDVRSNRLSGSIPGELAGLPLRFLNVSTNKLDILEGVNVISACGVDVSGNGGVVFGYLANAWCNCLFLYSFIVELIR